jgi:A/G-specific adenine glycosylase
MLEKELIFCILYRKQTINNNLLIWGKTHFRKFSWRKNKTPYSILIAEVLLKRTTATAVQGVYEDFLATYPNLQTLAKVDCQKLEIRLSKLGYYKVRAKILIQMANYLIENFRGEIPASESELLSIPHVGNYTANAILSFAYGIPASIVDTNVERVLRRIFFRLIPKGTSLKPFQEIADMLVPANDHMSFNYALLDLGGTVCLSRNPRCTKCPLLRVCDFSKGNS